MYHENVYREIAREFATGVGVATTIRVTEIAADPQVERSAEDRLRYRTVQDEWRVNRIITQSLTSGRYRDLTRRVFWLRREHPDWTGRRIYTTAWSGLTGRKRRKKETLT